MISKSLAYMSAATVSSSTGRWNPLLLYINKLGTDGHPALGPPDSDRW